MIYFSRRDVRGVENVVNQNIISTIAWDLPCAAASWTKVNPRQFYELNAEGDLVTPTVPFTGNVRQNFNFLSTDLVYNWQFAQGSFFSVVWKDIAGNFSRDFEKLFQEPGQYHQWRPCDQLFIESHLFYRLSNGERETKQKEHQQLIKKRPPVNRRPFYR